MQSPSTFLEHGPRTAASQPAAGQAASPQPPLPSAGSERRERIRVASQLPLSVKFGIYEAVAEAANISTRGMFLVMQRCLEMGAAIELVFRLPRRIIGVDGVWLRCQAEVVRVEEGLPDNRFGIGARISKYEVFLANGGR